MGQNLDDLACNYLVGFMVCLLFFDVFLKLTAYLYAGILTISFRLCLKREVLHFYATPTIVVV